MNAIAASDVVSTADVPAFDMDDDDIIIGALVLVLVRDSSDRQGVYLRHSPTHRLGWVERQGILDYALSVERSTNVKLLEGDDE